MEKRKKTLSKLKLNELSKNELDKRAMNTIKGGVVTCSSSCSLWVPGATIYARHGY